MSQFIDLHPPADDIEAEVLAGLRQANKLLPCKYFYDARGAELFEQICQLDEYYPTRTELSILQLHLPQIAEALGPKRWVIEPGSGSGIKTEALLKSLDQPTGYMAIDIAKDQLQAYGQRLAARFPQLHIMGMCADFTRDWQAPVEVERPVLWFPGSTIGNFSSDEAQAFLQYLRQASGQDSELLIGVDLIKPIHILEAAYNDAKGITADFNLNLLTRLNREIGSNFDLAQFRHEARWNDDIQAIQMFLRSEAAQTVSIAGETISFAAGEEICTEYSHKYTAEGFAELARSAGWTLCKKHTDEQQWFALFHFR